MAIDARAIQEYTSSESALVAGLTAAVLFVGGLVTAYQAVLRDAIATLSSVEWVVFTLGPFLVEPVLLFGLLYYADARSETTNSLRTLLPAVTLAVVVGTLLGQYVGVQLWSASFVNEVPVIQSWGMLFIPDPRALAYWRILLEPLVRDLLTVVAALALSRSTPRQER